MNKWIQKNGVYYYLNIHLKKPVAGFDLDGTIIIPKSGRKFPIDENDWKIIDSKMIDEINKLNNYNIVIFTNQLGLDKKLGLDKFQQKINNIKKLFNQDISVIIAYNDDFYRKPLSGMWTLLDDYNIPKEHSFFVGDAAGRKDDHSDSDLNFAHNIGIKFTTPELYLKNDFSSIKNNYINLKKWIKLGNVKINKDPLECVLLVGFPGCGKSTFANKHYLIHDNYQYINQDIDKTKEKINKKIISAIKNKKSIIIDNTNLDYTSRNNYIDMVKDHNYIIKIIIFDIPIDISQHMMYYRVNENESKLSKLSINIIVYRTLKKKCKFNEEGQIEIPEETLDDISIYRINKIYVNSSNKKEYEKIMNFRASIK